MCSSYQLCFGNPITEMSLKQKTLHFLILIYLVLLPAICAVEIVLQEPDKHLEHGTFENEQGKDISKNLLGEESLRRRQISQGSNSPKSSSSSTSSHSLSSTSKSSLSPEDRNALRAAKKFFDSDNVTLKQVMVEQNIPTKDSFRYQNSTSSSFQPINSSPASMIPGVRNSRMTAEAKIPRPFSNDVLHWNGRQNLKGYNTSKQMVARFAERKMKEGYDEKSAIQMGLEKMHKRTQHKNTIMAQWRQIANIDSF